MTGQTLLKIEDLRVEFRGSPAVQGSSFEVNAGERIAIVGESGSGKSVTALSILGLAPTHALISGSVRYMGRELIGLSETKFREIRGIEIGLILQDPSAALDPLKTVGLHIEESLRLQRGVSRKIAKEISLDLIRQVQISDPELRIGQRCHQLSGGMAQRAVTASVIALEPKLLIADEPTSSLDATTANGILELLMNIGRDRGMAVLLITHDLGIVSRFAQKVIVMCEGRIVEIGSVEKIFSHPRHPYTKALLASVPGRRGRRAVGEDPSRELSLAEPLSGCFFRSRCSHVPSRKECVSDVPKLLRFNSEENHLSACHFSAEIPAPISRSNEVEPQPHLRSNVLLEIKDLRKNFSISKRGRKFEVRAVDGVTLEIYFGEVLALVGESGSGKSTLGKVVLGLEKPTAGEVKFAGIDITNSVRHRKKLTRQRMQVIFQNPNSSLDPRMRIGDIIAEPLIVNRIGSHQERLTRVSELLVKVGLTAEDADKFPSEFSGGQRQRIAIARALAPSPELLICDEPLTALDVSVQAQILDLLQDIQIREGMAYLFIAHDLAVVRQLADRVAVMYLGHIVETAPAGEFFKHPHHPYSAALLSAMSVVDPKSVGIRDRIILKGAIPSPMSPPSGCVFHTRCWKVQEVCRTVQPSMVEVTVGRTLACHFPENTELMNAPSTTVDS